jgi:hypothetical protein
MTRFILALTRVSIVAVLLMPSADWNRRAVNAQSAKSSAPRQPAAKVILNVTATDFGIGPRQDYIYLRVSTDHSAEAETVKRKTVIDKADLATVKIQLTQDQFKEVQRLTEDPEILKLDALYRQRVLDGVLDAFTSWEIKIRRDDHEQKLEVIAFAPEQARLNHHPYPGPVVKLGCTIERVRGEIIGDSTNFDDGCMKVLGISHTEPR